MPRKRIRGTGAGKSNSGQTQCCSLYDNLSSPVICRLSNSVPLHGRYCLVRRLTTREVIIGDTHYAQRDKLTGCHRGAAGPPVAVRVEQPVRRRCVNIATLLPYL